MCDGVKVRSRVRVDEQEVYEKVNLSLVIEFKSAADGWASKTLLSKFHTCVKMYIINSYQQQIQKILFHQLGG